jgi:hypothetical protein
MNPILQGAIIFFFIFLLFIIRSVQAAKDKYREDHEPGNIMKKFYDDDKPIYKK